MDVMEDKMKTVQHRLQQPSIEPSLKVETSQLLRVVREPMRYVLEDDGEIDFILWYLTHEADRFHATEDDMENIDADEPRSRDLCTCRDSGCALKDGCVPVVVEEAETLSTGIRKFRQQHTGDPLVLNDAQDALDDLRQLVMEVFDLATISLSNKIEPSELDASDPIASALESNDSISVEEYVTSA